MSERNAREKRLEAQWAEDARMVAGKCAACNRGDFDEAYARKLSHETAKSQMEYDALTPQQLTRLRLAVTGMLPPKPKPVAFTPESRRAALDRMAPDPAPLKRLMAAVNDAKT